MTEFYEYTRDQQENVSKQSRKDVSVVHSSTRNQSYVSRHSTDGSDNNDVDRDAQHSSNDSSSSQTSLDDQLPVTHSPNPITIDNLSNGNFTSHTDKNSNKDDLSTVTDESENPTVSMKKRVKPIPASYTRRRPHLTHNSTASELSSSKLLTPEKKTKVARTTTKKSVPIFIAPKKPSSQPHTYSSAVLFDDSLQIKRKPILERQSALTENHQAHNMPTWSSVPPPSFGRYFTQTSYYNVDDSSSDESDHESLLIRTKSSKLRDQQNTSSCANGFRIPSAILITDPYGHSHPFDPDNESCEKHDENDDSFAQNSQSMDGNTLDPNNVIDISPAPEISPVSPTSPIVLDKHNLDIISEEEEEEKEEDGENDHDNDLTSSKDTSQRSPQPALSTQKLYSNTNGHELLSRRWSDEPIDQEKEQTTSPIIKMASATSVAKPTVNPSNKISKTKQFLMKLHLIPISKDDNTINSPPTTTTTTTDFPRKRTVRRAMDKTHSRTKLSSVDSSNPDIRRHASSSTITSNESMSRQKSTTDSIQTANSSHRNDSHDNKQTKADKFGSVGNLDVVDSDDDIDGTFEKAKLTLANRASSCMDMRGSQVSINSVLSDTKARYGLDVSGTIELKLSYIVATGALDVFVNKCTNLARAKRNQTSDPYVKTYLLPDRSKNSKRKTKVQKNTVDPVFEERLRYHVTKQEFETRVLWISVWSEASFVHNDFLGEIHIPLANCTLDKIEEHSLLAKMNRNHPTRTIEPTMELGEIHFELTYIESQNNKDLGVIQVSHIEARAIYAGRHPVDAVCKGLLMPDKMKRKLPMIRKGPSPKWDLPFRWDGVRRDHLKNASIEISVWSQERFRKTMLGFVRLNLCQGYFDGKPAKWLDATKLEKSKWEAFLQNPSQVHQLKLPLRPATIDK